MVEIEINGKKIEAAQGSMIIEVADQHDVRIPRFCYHKKLSVAANCRMCLVEVGDVRKPLPACATPITQGMKVFTRSKLALDAQRAVMEFLLINHPLDCPVCDQGGECELQDLAMGYGRDVSRFNLGKRAVSDHDVGPLIETEMTRCIHCTRCVRFGKEIAGLHELGVMNRGEHLEISTLVGRAITSELSGNMIDVCPVGALTSKPYRFSARAWELTQRPGIAAHDGVGSYIYAHTIHNEVKRIVPRECEALNETWVSDRDRFSYEGLYHKDRVLTPKIKRNGHWEEVNWSDALAFAAERLRAVSDTQGADALGALASPNSSCEEFYLFQKLMRGLGSAHIDHRLRQHDFSDENQFAAYPHSGVTLTELAKADVILLLGSIVRKEQPIVAHRIRMASLTGATVLVVNPLDDTFQFNVASKQIVPGGDLLLGIAKIAKALVAGSEKIKPSAAIAEFLKDITVDDTAQQQANYLKDAKQAVIFLGALALNHPQAAAIRGMADFIAQHTQTTLGLLCEGANSAGAYLMGAVPHRLPGGQNSTKQGESTQAMVLSEKINAMILLGLEAEYDLAYAHRAQKALKNMQTVIALTAYQTPHLLNYAEVILPITPSAEMAGTFVNMQGDTLAFSALTSPQGQSRPAWKILRVLANLLAIEGFDYQTLEDVQQEIAPHLTTAKPTQRWSFAAPQLELAERLRIAPVPIYAQDPLVRRATALQHTPDAAFGGVRINSAEAQALGLAQALEVLVRQQECEVRLPLVIDEHIPNGAVYLASGIPETRDLDGAYEAIYLEQVVDNHA